MEPESRVQVLGDVGSQEAGKPEATLSSGPGPKGMRAAAAARAQLGLRLGLLKPRPAACAVRVTAAGPGPALQLLERHDSESISWARQTRTRIPSCWRFWLDNSTWQA